MRDKVDGFIQTLTVLGRAACTVSGYAWELLRLQEWGELQIPQLLTVDQFTTTELTRYLLHRRETKASDATIKRCVSALRVFFRWLYGAQSPADALPMPTRLRRVRARRWLSETETNEILCGFDTATPLGKRDAALFALMLVTGLRAAEVCRLRLEDVDLERLTLFVRVKGGQTMAAWFTPDVAALINSWLTVRDRHAQENIPTLFISIGGIKPGRPLTTNGLRAMFRVIGQRHGLKLSPHDMRRTGAAQFINNGGSTRQLMELWRLKRLQEAETYTEGMLAQSGRKFLPRITGQPKL